MIPLWSVPGNLRKKQIEFPAVLIAGAEVFRCV